MAITTKQKTVGLIVAGFIAIVAVAGIITWQQYRRVSASVVGLAGEIVPKKGDGKIFGKVFDNKDLPEIGVYVAISGPSGNFGQSTGEDGSFVFTDLLAGEYIVSLYSPIDLTTQEKTVKVDANQTSEINF